MPHFSNRASGAGGTGGSAPAIIANVIPVGDGTTIVDSPVQYNPTSKRLETAANGFAYFEVDDSGGTELGYATSRGAAGVTRTTYDLNAVTHIGKRVSYIGRPTWVPGADVASASTVTFTGGASWTVTGTTPLNHVTVADWSASSLLILTFADALTVTHNAGSPPGGTVPFLTRDGANINTTAGMTLIFRCTGSAFKEVGR